LVGQANGQQVFDVDSTGTIQAFALAAIGVNGGIFSHDTNTNPATHGSSIIGQEDTPGGVAIVGLATSTVSGSFGVGVRGVSSDDAGVGVVGRASSLTGNTTGVRGRSDSSNGIGVQAFSPNIGILAQSLDCSGQIANPGAPCVPSPHDAGQFQTAAGGNILSGFRADASNNLTQIFFVDSNGTIASNAPTGTPPLVVASTTPVANLTAAPTTYNVNTANGAVTQVINAHILTGNITFSGTTTVALSSSAVFQSSTSYTCTLTTIGAAPMALGITYTDGSHFVVTTGTGGSTSASFICIGN